MPMSNEFDLKGDYGQQKVVDRQTHKMKTSDQKSRVAVEHQNLKDKVREIPKTEFVCICRAKMCRLHYPHGRELTFTLRVSNELYMSNRAHERQCEMDAIPKFLGSEIEKNRIYTC
uniref:Uncharacterized protein n=1 Tax=Romanomermis culicivorax TaxID=13658 RepID=A0A915JR07_ROMCU